jgi:hypothetical protein
MKTVQTLLLSLFIAPSLLSQTTSPDVIISSGEVIESEDGSISWTIGENLIETIRETDLSILQGYQEIEDMPVAIESAETENALILIFPTETEGIVNVVFNETMGMHLKGYLVDILGKRCAYYEFDQPYNQIDLSEFAHGMYLLIITDLENKPVHEIKLFKH